MTISVAKLATVADDVNAEESQENQDAVTVTQTDNAVTISGELNELNEFASTVSAQGSHKWIGLTVDTGEDSITTVKYNGTLLTSEDVAEATSVGVEAGSFVLWVKADEISSTAKSITLGTTGKADKTITISFVDAA